MQRRVLQGLSREAASATRVSPILARDRRRGAHCDRQREAPEAGQIIKSRRQAATESETADTPEYAAESGAHGAGKKWSSSESIKQLTRLVSSKIDRKVSGDSITRELDKLYAETRERRYARPRKIRQR
jgi:hypothetical protein